MKRYSPVERAYLGAVTAVMRRTMFVPPQRQFHRTFPAEVLAVGESAPRVRRLTLAGDGLRTLELTGPDEYCGLFMPPAGQPLTLPPGEKLNPRTELASMPESSRPELRWYTIRRHRPQLGEIDIDIVKHATGPGEDFLRRVRPGDQVGVREGVASYPSLAGRHILVGDETAAPAIGAILESLDSGVSVTAIVECPDAEYLADIDSDVPVTRLFRGASSPGTLLKPALAGGELGAYDFAWVAGEQSMAKDVRRLLIDRGTDRRRITFGSYWTLGRPRP